jgi:hypothetical protein
VGLIRAGGALKQVTIPYELVQSFKETFGVQTFVETGTFQGHTIEWAARYFAKCITVEGNEEFYTRTKARLGDVFKNIEFVCSESSVAIQKIVPTLTESSIFWLDAHWSCEDTFGRDVQHPLVNEVRAIVTSPHPHIIFIDDYRLLSYPYWIDRKEEWPSLTDIIVNLQLGTFKYYSAVVGDCLVSFPYSRDVIQILNKFRDPDLTLPLEMPE